ncbi:MAG: hypothetical protein ACFFEW_14605 [Candidatus Thorarchaeota archaeon]
MKRHYVTTIAAAMIMAVVLSLAVTAGGLQGPPAGKGTSMIFWARKPSDNFNRGFFGINIPPGIDTLELRYHVFGGIDTVVAMLAGNPDPVTSPVTIPIDPKIMPTLYFNFKMIPNDTGHIRVSVYHENRRLDSLDAYVYLIGDSLGYFTERPTSESKTPQTYGPYPLGFALVPVGELSYPGDYNLEFFITPKWPFDSVRFDITEVGKLKYHGPKSYSVPAEIGRTSYYTLPVTIPADDTSALLIEIYADGHNYNGTRLYFVTTYDTVEVYKGKPVPIPPPPLDIGVPDSISRRFRESHPEIKHRYPLILRLDPYAVPKLAGEGDFRLRVISFMDWGSTSIKMIKIDKVIYTGPTAWEIELSKGDSLEYKIPLTIPPGDTSMIQFELIADNRIRLQTQRYFVTTGDELEMWAWQPDPRLRHPIFGARSDTVRVHRTPDVPLDYVPDAIEIDRAYPIADTTLERYRREHDSVGEVLTGPDIHHRPQTDDSILDALGAGAENQVIETILDLRDSAHYEYASDRIDSLIETETPGYYRAFLTRHQAAELANQGIHVTRPAKPSGNGRGMNRWYGEFIGANRLHTNIGKRVIFIEKVLDNRFGRGEIELTSASDMDWGYGLYFL